MAMTPEQQVEYERLYTEFREAVDTAGDALSIYGMGSPQFHDADRWSGEIWEKMRKLRGVPLAHWMS